MLVTASQLDGTWSLRGHVFEDPCTRNKKQMEQTLELVAENIQKKVCYHALAWEFRVVFI